jgi:hypothetical protein
MNPCQRCLLLALGLLHTVPASPLREDAPDRDAGSPGHSCPIVWRDRVFVTTAIWPTGMSFKDKIIAKHRIHCFRASDGKQLWATTIPDGRCRINNPFHGYATPTPVTDGQHVFALFWAVGPPVPGLGVVKAVDAQKRTITVDDKTYPVATKANIIIDNRGGLAAVPIGATVSLRLCVDQKTVGTIAVTAK